MAQVRIEHVNISVSDPARTAQMLSDLFGWHIRWQGPAAMGGFTVHVGSDSDYLAVYAARPDASARAGFAKGAPLNHVGIEVDDLRTRERLAGDAHPLLLPLRPLQGSRKVMEGRHRKILSLLAGGMSLSADDIGLLTHLATRVAVMLLPKEEEEEEGELEEQQVLAQ